VARRAGEATEFARNRSAVQPLLAGEVCGRDKAVVERRRSEDFLVALWDARSVWRHRFVMESLGSGDRCVLRARGSGSAGYEDFFNGMVH
jgi:hypothetical protein